MSIVWERAVRLCNLESWKEDCRSARKYEELFTEKIISQTEQLLRGDTDPERDLGRGVGLRSAGDLLLLTAQFNHYVELSRLLEAYPHLLLHTNAKSESLLHIAAKFGHGDVVDVLLFHARLVGVEPAKMLIEMRSKGGNTALHGAVKAKMLPVAKRLASERVPMIREANEEGKSPLYLAVEMGFLKCVTMMLDIDPASSDQCGPGGRSLLHAAISCKYLDIAKILLDKKPILATRNDDKEQNTLHYAILSGCLLQVRFFLKMDRSAAYAMDNKGRSPLHLAAINGYTHMVRAIYMNYPDSAIFLDERGKNILHLAVENERIGLVAYIIREDKLSFLLNEKDANGDSPLHLAVKKIHTPLVYVLCTRPKVDKGIMDNKGQTALDIAESIHNPYMRLQQIQIIHILKNMGVPNGNSSNLTEHSDEYHKDGEETLTSMASLKSSGETLLILATLVATITFAAAFTMPGGYEQDGPNKGLPVLASQWAFKVFLIADTLAMTLSVFAIVLQFWAMKNLHPSFLQLTVQFCQYLIIHAILAMIVAFAAGVYAMVASTSKWLCIICLVVPTILLYILSPFGLSQQISDMLIITYIYIGYI